MTFKYSVTLPISGGNKLRRFREWAEDRDALRMEFFYREMRRKTGLLMDGDKPEGGEWNLDKQNRESPDDDMDPPERPKFEPDEITREVIEMVKDRFGDHFGSLERFEWPVPREEAEEAADAFFAERIEKFGPYQDAMVYGEDDLYHSMLSTSINLGLLDPLELCQRAEKAYRDGKAPLNSVEGFIRQLIGWREYVRGFYWYFMPGLESDNKLNAQRGLPEFYWTGETDMRCMDDSIRSTRQNAHAHHIQRLMVLGNFALLAGIKPREVQDWYLVVYADAYEWVELPNVAAMILYADGGLVASKPYAASGAYINRMSDYCAGCRYSPKVKDGENACPITLLYWNFLIENRRVLQANPRMAMAYRNLDRMDASAVQGMQQRATRFLDGLNAGVTTTNPPLQGELDL